MKKSLRKELIILVVLALTGIAAAYIVKNYIVYRHAVNMLEQMSDCRWHEWEYSGLGTLDRLCEQYYVFEGTENLQPRILNEVRSIVEGLRSDPLAQKALEQALNESADNVMVQLRAAFPKWKEEDFLLYLFAASGFSSTTISTLLGKDKPYVYNRLYRLKERIKNTPSDGQELFLDCLEK